MFSRNTPDNSGANHDAGSHAGDTLADITTRAIELATRAAERASQAAADARIAATPVMRQAALHSAATLSEAAERAAVLLAEAAERLADNSEGTGQIAGAVGRRAVVAAIESARPRKHRKWPYALLGGALVAGAVVAYLSPLADELRDRLLLTDDDEEDEEDEAITLPSDDMVSEGSPVEEVVGEPAHNEHHRATPRHHTTEGHHSEQN